MKEVNFYDSQYGHLTASLQTDIRRETYGEDLGQASWITLREALEWFQRLGLGPGQKALEVACGSGGVALRMARETGSSCVGVDINRHFNITLGYTGFVYADEYYDSDCDDDYTYDCDFNRADTVTLGVEARF